MEIFKVVWKQHNGVTRSYNTKIGSELAAMTEFYASPKGRLLSVTKVA